MQSEFWVCAILAHSKNSKTVDLGSSPSTPANLKK